MSSDNDALSRKVLLLEINEITWDLINPLIEQGKLPTLARLRSEGAFGAPWSVDLPPYLDPWITWTTVYTGKPRQEHNVTFLQQPPESIHAKRIWELCSEAGMSVGVYGSLCSWPPQKVAGFYVPDTFSQDDATYPEELRPIQKLNLTYTRSVRLPSDEDGLAFKAKLGTNLLRLGLRPSTMVQIAGQLARERRNPALRWQRVSLQPLVNFDFFRRLYLRHRPRFATFHTNHVAHYMHTYWKAMQPDEFRPLETSEAEVETYGKAIEYGYATADRLISNVLNLVDSDTVLVIASSMGQKPYKTELKTGKRIRQVRSLDRLVEVLGFTGKVRALTMMSDQFNIYSDPATLAQVEAAMKAAYAGQPDQRIFTVEEGEQAITATLNPSDKINPESQCFFPLSPGQPSFPYSELVHHTGQVKSGCHDPKGMLVVYGAGIRKGQRIGECNNLDLAPTLMTLLGLAVPPDMRGRVLYEAFDDRASYRAAASAMSAAGA